MQNNHVQFYTQIESEMVFALPDNFARRTYEDALNYLIGSVPRNFH